MDSLALLPVFQTRTIKLFCWVLNISKNPFSFPIDVEDNTTVDDLKQRIVKEKPNKFVDVDADDLTRWKVSGYSPLSITCPQLSCKVSFPITKDLMDTVSGHQFLDKDSLLAGNLLWETFPPPTPVQKTLHIVVQLPPSRESSPCLISACSTR